MNETVEAQPVFPGQDKTSGMAIAALVCAIIGFICCWNCCGQFVGIAALVLGFLELQKIKKGESSAKGKWMAITAIIVGIIDIIIGIINVLWLFLGGGMAYYEEIMRNMQ
jgi:uncharacterized membrane protein